MRRTVVRCLLVVFLFFGLSGNVHALTSDAPPMSLSTTQRDYLSRLGTLRVLTAPGIQPYSYENTGLSIDILERLCDSAGISLEVIESASYADALLRLEQGEAHLAAVKVSPDGAAEDFLPYLTAPLQLVTHKEASVSSQSSLSLVQLDGIDFNYTKKYSFVDGITRTSVLDCLNAVRSRQADIFLCDIYQLSVFSKSFAARDLSMSSVPQREVTIGFGLGPYTEEALISALQSTVDSFSTTDLSTSLGRHSQYQDTGFRLTQLVYENPFELLCALAALSFVILLCIFVSVRVWVSQHQELRGYEESYRMLAETFGEAGMEYDFLNDRLTLFGGRRDQIDLPEVVEQVHAALGQGTLRISLTPESLDELLQNNSQDHSYEVDLQCGMKDGSLNWFRVIYIVVCTSESHRRPIRLIGCLVNVEDEYQEKERLLQIGYRDHLTGLLNRTSGEAESLQALETSDTQKVLLFLDIDYFKNFNDRYGHSCGDAVLRTLAEAMGEVFTPDDILCRWGGDEFLLLIQGQSAQKDHLEVSLQKLQSRMSFFTYLEKTLPVTLSIGGAAARPELSLQALFELADAALYEVKKAGRNHFHITGYSPSDSHASAEEVQP